MNDAHQPRLDAPQLRTLLLTDLCDSTELVEKLGDAHAAELFREHDHLVLVLQREWRGRLIDRSDGLLLLFERPIDGLGFALDYQQGLRDLGKARSLRLLARAGLHVGEVLTWRNSEEAVQIGAKPLEVEGLAKPMAARLMTLARPGQILLSAVGESLTHRAARELGARGEQLLWKSHGRWRFKGVPTAQEIYEVGEAGLTPLRAPKSSPKARRDLPLWRRPAALVAEVALIASIGVGTWFMTRPEPAIAFAERDWVVVGDLRNLTGDTLLDDSLQQAFRISLEQSRYVNVMSDMKVRQTLALMRKDPNQSVLDRELASEVAIRDGARAVILPTVIESGGALRVTAEVIDPKTQATVYALSAAGKGNGGALASIDRVNEELRIRLGEAMTDVSASSAPLPKVATSSLDALRAYGLATKLYGMRRFDLARDYFQKAIELDSGFALAYLGVMRVYISTADNRSAIPYLERARSLRSSLPARDAMYLDAWVAELGEHPWKDAREKWDMLAQMYPDYFAGSALSAWADFSAGDFESAQEKTSRFSVPQNPLRDVAIELKGRSLLAQNKYSEAKDAFLQAEQLGGYGPTRRRVAALAAGGEYVQARELLSNLSLEDGLTNGFEKISVPLDQGDYPGAITAAKDVLKATDGATPLLRYGLRIGALSALSQAKSSEFNPQNVLSLADQAIADAVSSNAGDRDDLAMMAMAALRLAQRNGVLVGSVQLKKLGDLVSASGNPVLRRMQSIIVAQQESLRGAPEEALKFLESRESADGPNMFQWHVAKREFLSHSGRISDAEKEDSWLASNGGLAYIEPYGGQALQVMSVGDASQARRRVTHHESAAIAAVTR